MNKCGSTFGRIVDNVQTKMPQHCECGGGEGEHQPLRHKKRRVVNVLFSDRKVQVKSPRQTSKEIKRDPGYVTDDLMFLYLKKSMFYRPAAKASSICMYFQFYIFIMFLLVHFEKSPLLLL